MTSDRSVTRESPGARSLAERVLAGDRLALAKAITLAESTRVDDRPIAAELLDRVLPASGKARRIAITGAPGVGKSTFIQALGMHAVSAGRRMAVLAVDPTSRRSGGSILGDRTRMGELVAHPDVFVRPSPSGGSLGGVAPRTRDALLLAEAWGAQLVLVETVGVGQSETAAADLVDLFCVLVAPGGGDELQGLKRGLMELADIVVVNKCDGDLAAVASRTANEYRSALTLMRPRWRSWRPRVLTCSAIRREGIAEFWEAVEEFWQEVGSTGELDEHRREQRVRWMWSEVEETLVHRLRQTPTGDEKVRTLENEVAAAARSHASGALGIIRLLEEGIRQG
ncbi:MAG: ATPase/protein kinase [Acidimicrobiales bacterium]|nr:MAG: ATPase/protein kinase [Acidimicrobiales bacterium]